MTWDVAQLFVFDMLKQIYDARKPIIFFGVLVYIVYILHKMQNNKFNRVDFADLICTNGYINDKKALRTGAFFLLSWVVVYQTLNNHLSEWFAVLYAGLFVSNALIDRWMRAKENMTLGTDAAKVRGEYELGSTSATNEKSKAPPAKNISRDTLQDDDTGAASKLDNEE